MKEVARAKRAPQQRSEVMRGRLLDATLEVILEKGWARASTPAICRHAGISRGAQTHHFPTKLDLLLAAVKRSSRGYSSLVYERIETLDPDETPLRAYLEALWQTCLDGQFMECWLEALVAARTDSDLCTPVAKLDTKAIEAMRSVADALDDCSEHTGFAKDLIELSVYLLRGMVVQRGLHEDEEHRRRLFEMWCSLVVAALDKQNALE